MNLYQGHEPNCPSSGGCFVLNRSYVNAVTQAGGVPLALIMTEDNDAIDRILDCIDGLILTGGWDMDPSFFGEELHPKAEGVSQARTRFEIELTRRARKRVMPTLGVCLGMQTINVAMGGTIYQDIPSQVDNALDHRMSDDHQARKGDVHPITVTSGTRLHSLLGRDTMMVNSLHHQAVRDVGEGLRVSAVSPDGIVEGLEGQDDQFLVMVQWHPEELSHIREHEVLFEALVSECAG